MTDTKSNASPEDILVGGQAVIEGVMMRAPRAYAVAVRRADGSIEVKRDYMKRLSESWKPLSWFVIRGFAVLLQSLFLGIRILNYSANIAMAETRPHESQSRLLANERKDVNIPSVRFTKVRRVAGVG